MIRLRNPILTDEGNDYLYHLGISKSSIDLVKEYGDVKFVCTGGSPSRIEKYAMNFAKETKLEISKNLCSGDRFVMFKTGPVLWVNHGMGVPSLSIMLSEVIKLLHYAKAKNVLFFRLGTSGGVGVPPGTVVITESALNGSLREEYMLYILGVKFTYRTDVDKKLIKDLTEIAEKENVASTVGKTMCADDFYEGQGRLDGAFCDYTEKDKFDFLKKLQGLGVRNIEMEASCFIAMLRRAEIRGGILCVTLLDRLKGDQVDLDPVSYNEFQQRPYKIIASYIKQQLKL